MAAKQKASTVKENGGSPQRAKKSIGRTKKVVKRAAKTAKKATGRAKKAVKRATKKAAKTETTESQERTLLGYGFDPDQFSLYTTGACDMCSNTGFHGRIGTHEVLTMSPELRELVNRRASDEELHEAAIRAGMIPIFQDAMSKVASGVTSFEEAVRVVREK